MKMTLGFFVSLFWLLVAAAASADPALRVRIAAANVTSGRYQSYDPGHGIRILKAVQPDIAAVQEMNFKDNSDESIRAFVDDAFGTDFEYYRENNPKFHIPNGIVSRFPLLQSGSWVDPIIPDRSFAWAEVYLSGTEETLWVISVHLSSKSAPNRAIEAEHLVKRIKENIPEGALLVIAGDLNTKTDRESAIDILSDVAAEKKAPADPNGKTATNQPRSKKYDWVLPSATLAEHQIAVELDSGIFPSGLVFDTRTFLKLPAPALSDDSAAEGMQHMLVVKDFAF